MKRAGLRFLLILAFLSLSAGCSRIPKIIVLEDPLSAAEHVDLGVSYERKGELDLAQREYERALRKDGGFPRARVNLGNVFLAKKEYDKAREEYLRALEARPGDPEATNNLAWAAILSGKEIGDARRRMEEVLRAKGGRAATLLDTLGVLRTRTNDPKGALEAFAEAEAACAAAGAAGDPGCPGGTIEEIRAHRGELRPRFPAGAPVPPLVQ